MSQGWHKLVPLPSPCLAYVPQGPLWHLFSEVKSCTGDKRPPPPKAFWPMCTWPRSDRHGNVEGESLLGGLPS